jgi:hypothetical protein
MQTEMQVWDDLPQDGRDVAFRQARRLLSWSGRVSSRVMPPGPPQRFGDIVTTDIEYVNRSIAPRFDREIKKSVDRMAEGGVPRALIPLCVAVWREALVAFPFDEEHEAEDLSAALLMHRVRSTEKAAWQLKHHPDDEASAEVLRERGLMR